MPVVTECIIPILRVDNLAASLRFYTGVRRRNLGGQLKTGNLWTGQNRQFPVRPRPVSSTSFRRQCANPSAPWFASFVART